MSCSILLHYMETTIAQINAPLTVPCTQVLVWREASSCNTRCGRPWVMQALWCFEALWDAADAPINIFSTRCCWWLSKNCIRELGLDDTRCFHLLQGQFSSHFCFDNCLSHRYISFVVVRMARLWAATDESGVINPLSLISGLSHNFICLI